LGGKSLGPIKKKPQRKTVKETDRECGDIKKFAENKTTKNPGKKDKRSEQFGGTRGAAILSRLHERRG